MAQLLDRPVQSRTQSHLDLLRRWSSKFSRSDPSGAPTNAGTIVLGSSPTVAAAEEQLDKFGEIWDSQYPAISKQWRLKWSDILSMFDFPEKIGRVTYTTNAIESLGSVICKYTKNRGAVPQRAVGFEADFHGDPGGVEAMDPSDQALEAGPEPPRDPVPRPNSQRSPTIDNRSPDTKIRTGPQLDPSQR